MRANAAVNRWPRRRALFLRAPVGDLGLPQVEFALDPPPRLVLELGVAKEIVHVLPFGLDQLQLDIAVQIGELLVPGVAVAALLDMLEPIPLMRAQRPTWPRLFFRARRR